MVYCVLILIAMRKICCHLNQYDFHMISENQMLCGSQLFKLYTEPSYPLDLSVPKHLQRDKPLSSQRAEHRVTQAMLAALPL